MFRTLLVANRGEIAGRIFRTARRLGMTCVAVYSDADARSQHVRQADRAVHLGGAAPLDSYLNIERVIAAAVNAGADAVHPGYGFLAENAEFAERVADAGMVFVGPPPAAMRAVGDKSAARKQLASAGIPIVPGIDDAASTDELIDAATRLEYPLMIKAVAGGGGRGMRRVAQAADLPAAIATCQREAMAAFGNDQLLLEQCVDHARHIEVQVFADQHGNVVHLFERDCSAQRRHQKIVEEAPASNLAPHLVEQLHSAATAVARAVNYVGAGTVEFMVPTQPIGDDEFYFLEMNARLQVEHPVTEAITGTDLVEWQLRIAAGAPLPCEQAEIRCRGHAIEARLCAEDPAQDYRPAPGTLHHFELPPEADDLRIDSAVAPGDTIPPNYDSMIAKVIASGPTRTAAVDRLRTALSSIRSSGPPTNRDLLLDVIDTDDFRTGQYTTDLVDRTCQATSAAPTPPPMASLAATALDQLLTEANAQQASRATTHDPHSPFAAVDGWRIGRWATHAVAINTPESACAVNISRHQDRWLATVASDSESSAEVEVDAQGNGRYGVRTGDRSQIVHVLRADHTVRQVFVDHRTWRVEVVLGDEAELGEEAMEGDLRAPLPGRLLHYHVQVGDQVAPGDPLAALEAMKTEHTIRAPTAGRVASLFYNDGDLVEEGATLLSFETEEQS